MPDQLSLFADNPEYDAFVDKFQPKKTTDDCYTPPLIYDTILNWVCNRYNIDPACVVRPFYPGGDYQADTYPPGCLVLDNPPFSILTQIVQFYLDQGIDFFLFAPSLTCLSSRTTAMRINHIIADANITYDNGAVVRTAFVTNLDRDIILQTAPDLRAAIAAASALIAAQSKTTLPKYTYPSHVVTAANAQYMASHDVELVVRREDCCFIPALDAQKAAGKAIFGGGLLLSDQAAAKKAAAEKAAAEKAAAEKAAAEKADYIVWELSNREKQIVATLGKGGDKKDG